MSDALKPRVVVEPAARHAVAKVTGRLDAAGVAAVEPVLVRAAADHERLVLDLAGVPYLCSLGLRLLLGLARAQEKRAGRLVVVDPSDEVAGVLAIAGLEKPLRVCTARNLAATLAG